MRTKTIIMLLFLVFVSVAGFTARVMMDGPKCMARETTETKLVGETNFFVE